MRSRQTHRTSSPPPCHRHKTNSSSRSPIDASRHAQQQASEEERRRGDEKTPRRLRDEWDELAFPEKQDLLREGVERIVVTDDNVQLVLRS